jgi:Icc protein
MRILQITDCHVLPNGGPKVYGADTFRALQRVLTAALALDEPPDLIIATGDLSEDGSPDSYRRLRDAFLGAGLPVYVIPGNHDSSQQMDRCLIGAAVRMEAYVDIVPWRMVFLDSTVAGAAHGYLDDRELRRLDALLSEAPERPSVVAVHHSPIRPCPSSGCHLKNDFELIAVLDSHPNARVVLAGHSHQQLERQARYAALLTTPATSAECRHAQRGAPVDHEDFWASHEFDAARHAFRMLTLRSDGNVDTRIHWVVGDDE